MTKFFEEVQQLPGKCRTNVFALLMLKLSNYKPESAHDAPLIKSLLNEIKVCFHNHEQQFGTLSFILKQNRMQYKRISNSLNLFLVDVLTTLDDADFRAYFIKYSISETDLQCRLQRLFESNVAVNMLCNPSQNMWASVNTISEKIISLLEKYKTNKIMVHFLRDLGPSRESDDLPQLALAFGRFSHTPSVDEVIAVLKEGNKLSTVMLIHCLFMGKVDIYIKQSSPKNLVAYKGDFADYLRESDEGEDLRDFFWDYITMAPHLYTDRGRAEFDEIASKSLGIALLPDDRAIFPSVETTWYPDCLCQQADLDSIYVNSLIKRDIPYVAGPSGMTSVLCGAMVYLGEWDEKNRLEQQNYYLLAVMAFIVGGGLHSIHEVLTTPCVRLGLLKGYMPFGERAGNYDIFFTLFNQDAVVVNNIRAAWKTMMTWIKHHYPTLVEIEQTQLTETSNFDDVISDESFTCCCIA